MLLHTEEYIDYLRNTKHSSVSTVQSYLRDINKFKEYIDVIKIKYNKVDKQTILSYLMFMQKNGQAISSVLRMVASLRSFYGYIFLKGYIKDDPTVGIEAPKAEKREFEVLTANETELLLMQPKCVNFKGYRDKAMLELLYATGIKVSELIEIKIDDVNIDDAYIICGNNKTRVVPMGTIAAGAVKEYLQYMEKTDMAAIKHNDLLFVNVSGSKLSRQGFWKILKYYKDKAKIKKEITPNTLRHSFAVHLMENGADVASVQEMLGHKAVISTKVYADIVSKKISEVYKKAHPRA